MRIGVEKSLEFPRVLFAALGAVAFALEGPSALAATVDAADGTADTSDIITVTATRRPSDAFTFPGSVSVIDKAAIDDLVPSDIGNLLEDVPGVQFDGGPRRTALEPSIRGIQGAGVLVLFDDLRQNFLSGHDGRFFH